VGVKSRYEKVVKMIYDRDDYLSSADYKKMCKVPKGCTKLRGASYVFTHGVSENSDFHAFGIDTAEVSTLVSYDTPICDYCANVLIISLNAFGYSNTTCRHLSEFLRRYTSIDYTTVKALYKSEEPIAGQFFVIDGVTVLFV
jgi:hypothetical protein